eukprot:Skav234330  [mRNA]  locus=scaffold306:63032:74862:+ [translate_table: standard]
MSCNGSCWAGGSHGARSKAAEATHEAQTAGPAGARRAASGAVGVPSGTTAPAVPAAAPRQRSHSMIRDPEGKLRQIFEAVDVNSNLVATG